MYVCWQVDDGWHIGSANFFNSVIIGDSSSRKISITIAVIMTIIIIIDLLATRQILFFDNTWQAIIFILTIVIAYGFGSLILLRYTRKASTELRAKNPFINTMHLAVTIIQFSLLGILLFIIYGNSISCPDYFSFCMVSRSLATSINAIASASAGIILGIISFKFFSWYKLT